MEVRTSRVELFDCERSSIQECFILVLKSDFNLL